MPAQHIEGDSSVYSAQVSQKLLLDHDDKLTGDQDHDDKLTRDQDHEGQTNYDHDIKTAGLDNVSLETEVVDRAEDSKKSTVEAVEYLNPTDEGWAWMVLLGVFGLCMFGIGFLKSFGILYVELSKKYMVTNKALSSVQSLTGFFYLGLGPISNALSVRFTNKVVTFIGGLMVTVGLCLSAFAPSVEVLYITYGFISGIGMGLCFSPSIVIIAFYFKKRRALATGIALSGGGLGAMVLPYFLRFLLNLYGLEGTFLIYGAFMSNLCVFANLMRAYQSYPTRKIVSQHEGVSCQNKDLEITDPQIVIHNENNTLDTTKSENHCDHLMGKLSLDRPSNKYIDDHVQLTPNIQRRKHLLGISSLSKSSLNNSLSLLSAISSQDIQKLTDTAELDQIQIDEVIEEPKTKKTFQQKFKVFIHKVDWSLFKNPVFVLMFVMLFLAMISYHSLFNIVPPYAEEIGLSKSDGVFLLFIFGLADLVGRAFVGFLMDVFRNRRIQIYTVCVFVSSVGVILTPEFKTVASICAFFGFYGIFAGGFNATVMVIVVDQIGLQRLPSAFGFICFGVSLSMITNPIVSGAIKDGTGSWKNAFRFTGSLSLLAVVLLLLQPLVTRKCMTKDRNTYVKG